MRALLLCLVAAALGSCGGAKKPPPEIPINDSTQPTVAKIEPFALAAIAYDIDLFATKPQLELPSDARMRSGKATSERRTVGRESLTYTLHTLGIELNDDFDRFVKDIAPAVA